MVLQSHREIVPETELSENSSNCQTYFITDVNTKQSNFADVSGLALNPNSEGKPIVCKEEISLQVSDGVNVLKPKHILLPPRIIFLNNFPYTGLGTG